MLHLQSIDLIETPDVTVSPLAAESGLFNSTQVNVLPFDLEVLLTEGYQSAPLIVQLTQCRAHQPSLRIFDFDSTALNAQHLTVANLALQQITGLTNY
ncbi:hypothetical protein AQ708_18000 [Burkholderia pseudomallei]|nr:hypothetical protein AQ708_18000 [Burkholderia pseudomallei]